MRPSIESTSPFTNGEAAAAGDGEAAGLAAAARAGDAAAGAVVGFGASVGLAGAGVGAAGALLQAARISTPDVSNVSSARGARRVVISSIRAPLNWAARSGACASARAGAS